MALQVWLPLDGDLRNQGLNGSIIATNNGVTINNAGKIGKCYSFGTGRSYLTLPKECMTSFHECSVSFWVKFLTWNTNYATIFQAGLGSTPWNNYIFGILRNNNAQTFCFTISNGSSATNTSCLTSSLNLNEWYHLTFTYSEGHCKIYTNGQLTKDFSTTIIPNFANISHITIGVGNNGTGYQTNMLLNDFRIYDHCLSIKEVKELAKGLILHYPMNNKYLEETTNLITSEDALSNTCYNGATSKYGYGTNSDIHKIVTIFQGQKGTKVYMGTNGNNARPYSYINDMYVSDGTNKPAYKTLSFDYYTNIGTYISPYKLGSGNGTATWKVFNGVTTTGTYTNSGNIPIETNKWNHIEITFHGTTAANCEWGYIINGAQHVSNTNNFWFYANVQLEEKDHATGYIPYGTHRDKETIELDCAPAGNQNDGTIIGTITAAADSPRYESSYFFDGVNSAIQVPYNATVFQTNFTINLWFKKTELGSKNYETLFGGPSGFEMDTRSSSSTTLSLYMTSTRGGNVFSPFNFNEWYMVTLVNNGTNELYYINGELKKTIEKKSMPTGNYFIGAWSTSDKQNFKGYISDFRIYCTALSAEDIKELYNTAAQVDKDGNIYAYEFKEA